LGLLSCSAFFSGSETAFFSIPKLRLRAIREDGSHSGLLVARMMDHPGQFLTTILVGNMIVNVLISMFLGTRMEEAALSYLPDVNKAGAYGLAVALTTTVLVFFGEIAPKVFAVRTGERMARITVYPLLAVDRLLAPVRVVLLGLTEALFRVTRFHAIHAAPFITDEEFKSALSDGEAQGVIEDDERQMIQGILEFGDAQVREILVPRPDMITLSEDATIAEALAAVREHQYSRMPVYREDLDHITGMLFSKDLLPCLARGELDRTIRGLLKPVHFVPGTMTARQFVADARRHRAHLALVVDEYGGTAGLVTLEDAMEEVVGDIGEEGDQEEPGYTKLGEGLYRIEGSLPLDAFNELAGVNLVDETHETLAGFLMDHIEKIPEPGDRIEYAGVVFTIEKCDGKRVESVRAQLPRDRGAAGPPVKTEVGAP
jgi:CBS domain containing-hemolysin-like protein